MKQYINNRQMLDKTLLRGSNRKRAVSEDIENPMLGYFYQFPTWQFYDITYPLVFIGRAEPPSCDRYGAPPPVRSCPFQQRSSPTAATCTCNSIAPGKLRFARPDANKYLIKTVTLQRRPILSATLQLIIQILTFHHTIPSLSPFAHHVCLSKNNGQHGRSGFPLEAGRQGRVHWSQLRVCLMREESQLESIINF